VKGSIVNVASILDCGLQVPSLPMHLQGGVVQMTKHWRWNGRATAFVSTRSLLDTSKPNSTTILSGARGSGSHQADSTAAALANCGTRRAAFCCWLRRLVLHDRSVIVADGGQRWFRPLNGGFSRT